MGDIGPGRDLIQKNLYAVTMYKYIIRTDRYSQSINKVQSLALDNRDF